MKNVLVLFVFAILTSCSTDYKPKNNYRDVTPEWVKEAYNPLPPSTIVVPGGTELNYLKTIKTDEETIKLEEVPGQSFARTGDFSAKSDLKVVKQLAELGNCLVFKQKFLDSIAAHKQFDYTKDSSEVVANKLSLYTPVVLTTYKKYFTKSIAYRNKGSNVIYLNVLKLEKVPTKERLNTIWHERGHVVGYGHGNNYKKGKENSVPYGTGSMAEEYFDECYAGLK